MLVTSFCRVSGDTSLSCGSVHHIGIILRRFGVEMALYGDMNP